MMASVRRLSSGALAALLTLTTSAAPVLDRGAVGSSVAVESPEHCGEGCGGHDHRICAQLGANPPAPHERAVPLVFLGSMWATPATGAALFQGVSPSFRPTSRDPPAMVRI
jgi:hypothetical protein